MHAFGCYGLKQVWDMNELEFSQWVSVVCKRPRMFMPIGTLGHIISFMEGLSKGFGV
jgi:hypothetical protein